MSYVNVMCSLLIDVSMMVTMVHQAGLPPLNQSIDVSVCAMKKDIFIDHSF